MSIQTKVLRIIETGICTRLGAEKGKQLDFRLIAATNRDLEQMCNNGSFRRDLYYRLNVLSIEIPPLRDRKEDILPLAQLFLSKLNKKYALSKIFSYQTKQQLQDYSWPGNVRELRNIVERLVLTSQTDILEFNQLQQNLNPSSPDNFSKELQDSNILDPLDEQLPLKDLLAEYERKIIIATLKRTDGNVAKAAEKLQIHKTGLYRKIKEYRIQRAH